MVTTTSETSAAGAASAAAVSAARAEPAMARTIADEANRAARWKDVKL